MKNSRNSSVMSDTPGSAPERRGGKSQPNLQMKSRRRIIEEHIFGAVYFLRKTDGFASNWFAWTWISLEALQLYALALMPPQLPPALVGVLGPSVWRGYFLPPLLEITLSLKFLLERNRSSLGEAAIDLDDSA